MEDFSYEIIWISQCSIDETKPKDTPTEDELPSTKKAKLETNCKSIDSKSQDPTTDKGCFDLEGGNNCKKAQNHSAFIPFVDFNINNFPQNFQDPLLVDLVKALGSLVVMLNLSFASKNRPQYFPGTKIKYPSSCKNGSGKIIFSAYKKGTLSNHCPCRQCQQCKIRNLKPYTKWGEIKVVTAAHVIYDDIEAKNSTCILNFDTEDHSGVQELKYLRTEKLDVMSDRSVIIFVTHDVHLTFGLIQKIYEYKKYHENAYAKYKSMTPAQNSECQLNCDSKLRTKDESLGFSKSSEKQVNPEAKESLDRDEPSTTNKPQDKASNSAADVSNISGNNLAILISHPHGWSKKVSIGKSQRNVHKTDYFKRREYTYYEYVLTSCGGSSGAPVYILGKKNVWTNHPHSGSNGRNEGTSALEFERM